MRAGKCVQGSGSVVGSTISDSAKTVLRRCTDRFAHTSYHDPPWADIHGAPEGESGEEGEACDTAVEDTVQHLQGWRKLGL